MSPTTRVSQQGAARRIRLLDALVSAGIMSAEKARKQLPAIVGLAWQTTATAGYGSRPDDDFALFVDGQNLSDGRNNVGTAYSTRWASNKLSIACGAIFECFTFDGWPGSWFHLPWRLTVLYSTGETRIIEGGQNSGNQPSSIPTPSPIPPNYYSKPPKISDYYRNGWGTLAPPASWPWPKFLGQRIEKYLDSEYEPTLPIGKKPI